MSKLNLCWLALDSIQLSVVAKAICASVSKWSGARGALKTKELYRRTALEYYRVGSGSIRVLPRRLSSSSTATNEDLSAWPPSPKLPPPHCEHVIHALLCILYPSNSTQIVLYERRTLVWVS